MINTTIAFAAVAGSVIHCFCNIHSPIILIKFRQGSNNWRGDTITLWTRTYCTFNSRPKLLLVTVPSRHLCHAQVAIVMMNFWAHATPQTKGFSTILKKIVRSP